MNTNETHMNSVFTIWATGLLCFCVVMLMSCGGTTSGISTVGNPGFDMPTGKTAFYSPATDTTPVITASTSSGSSAVKYISTDWDSGHPVQEIFNTFQEYTYPDDEGVIDISNIYKLLFEAGNNYETALETVEELNAATEITSPFDFGTDVVSYTHATDHYALSKDGDTVSALLTWIWDEDPKFSYAVIEGTYNETTGDLTLNLVYIVDYETDSDYCLRTYISGNELTHEFTIKYSKTGSEDDTYTLSMIGTGVSQSDSEEAYFLIKMKDNDNLSEYTDGRYYKFSASVDEDTMKTYASDGFELDEIDDPNNYAEILDDMTFFAMDGSDHALSTDDFTSSDLVLDY
jgi:hypothetical protein